jgi:hypothetical protein
VNSSLVKKILGGCVINLGVKYGMRENGIAVAKDAVEMLLDARPNNRRVRSRHLTNRIVGRVRKHKK